MSSEKMKQLVALLLSRTNAGQLKWSPTEEDDVFQAGFPDFTVRVWSRSKQGVSIYNSNGQMLESVTDDEIGPWAQISDLFSLARRTALGVDDALDKLIGELEVGPEVQPAVDILVDSGNYATTHAAIATLANFPKFTLAQANALVGAALSNGQVAGIIKDPDVREFYTRLLEKQDVDIEPSIADALRTKLSGF